MAGSGDDADYVPVEFDPDRSGAANVRRFLRANDGEARQKHVVDAFPRSKGWVSVTLDEMADDGQVEKTREGRENHVELTTRRYALRERVDAVVDRTLDRLDGAVSVLRPSRGRRDDARDASDPTSASGGDDPEDGGDVDGPGSPVKSEIRDRLAETDESEVLTQARLVEELPVSESTVSNHLAEMREADEVATRPDPADPRRNLVLPDDEDPPAERVLDGLDPAGDAVVDGGESARGGRQ